MRAYVRAAAWALLLASCALIVLVFMTSCNAKPENPAHHPVPTPAPVWQ